MAVTSRKPAAKVEATGPTRTEPAAGPAWHQLPKTSHCPACQRLVTDRAIRSCATRYCPGQRGKL
jgi:hypothetical protein